jgi:hypothetical protein
MRNLDDYFQHKNNCKAGLQSNLKDPEAPHAQATNFLANLIASMHDIIFF